jgi:hypothetical protein
MSGQFRSRPREPPVRVMARDARLQKQPCLAKHFPTRRNLQMTQAPRKSLEFHNSGNRFGVNEKPLPILIRLGIVPHNVYLISQE